MTDPQLDCFRQRDMRGRWRLPALLGGRLLCHSVRRAFTSGTTAIKKGALMTPQNELGGVEQSPPFASLRKPDVDEDFVFGLMSPEHQTRLGKILAAFSALEYALLISLSERLHSTGGGCVIFLGSQIRLARQDPGAILDICSLISQGPATASCSALVRDFHKVLRQRNTYAHALWKTRREDGLVFVSVSDATAKAVSWRNVMMAELDQMIESIHELHSAIKEGVV